MDYRGAGVMPSPKASRFPIPSGSGVVLTQCLGQLSGRLTTKAIGCLLIGSLWGNNVFGGNLATKVAVLPFHPL